MLIHIISIKRFFFFIVFDINLRLIEMFGDCWLVLVVVVVVFVDIDVESASDFFS